jgi:hypothetical protein
VQPIKALENLILAGGFDSFSGTLRSQYFHDEVELPFMKKR